MAVVLKGVPGGYSWGWFSREDQRMHIQSVDDEHSGAYKVWLEERGHRVFQPEAALPRKVSDALAAEVANQRRRIEASWASFMVRKGWLELSSSPGTLTLTIYPRTAQARTVAVDLRAELPGAWERLNEANVALSNTMAAIVLGTDRPEDEQDHIPLPGLIWSD
jgi:hypothetical protein